MTASPALLAALLLSLATAPAARAHHSFNMFALDKVVTVEGTVKQYRWSMPHVWLYTLVPGKAGGPAEEWGFECHAPNLVTRKGWSSHTFKEGDKVTILMHPMKDGTHAGSVISVTLADGQVLWNADSVNAP